MHPFDRAGLTRPILTALGVGTLLGFAACGGKAEGIDPNHPEYGEDDGGGPGAIDNVGSVGGGAGSTGTGGRAGTGGAGGGGGTAGSVSYGGDGGYSGSASTGGYAGYSGSASTGGDAGYSGSAGSTSMSSSVCVNLDLGLAGLPMSAFPASDYFASQLCGGQYDDDHIYQVICLPTPPGGQSCNSLYTKSLIGLLYNCGLQHEASFVCGPQRPPTNTEGCAGNECCYVLGGSCP